VLGGRGLSGCLPACTSFKKFRGLKGKGWRTYSGAHTLGEKLFSFKKRELEVGKAGFERRERAKYAEWRKKRKGGLFWSLLVGRQRGGSTGTQ